MAMEFLPLVRLIWVGFSEHFPRYTAFIDWSSAGGAFHRMIVRGKKHFSVESLLTLSQPDIFVLQNQGQHIATPNAIP